MEKTNPIVKMTTIIDAIERRGGSSNRSLSTIPPTGPLTPKVSIGGIAGGAPYRPSYFPGVCAIYVDIRMPPQVHPVQIKSQLERVVNETGIAYELDVYPSLLGHEGNGIEPLLDAAEEVYQYLIGEKIKPEAPDRASLWTDTNIYNALGIPAIKIGPRGRRMGPRNEEIEIDTMVKAAQVYSLMALEICTRERT